jgi:GGDEF domain-containing protein
MLRELARRVRKSIRGYGGEKFVIVMARSSRRDRRIKQRICVAELHPRHRHQFAQPKISPHIF